MGRLGWNGQWWGLWTEQHGCTTLGAGGSGEGQDEKRKADRPHLPCSLRMSLFLLACWSYSGFFSGSSFKKERGRGNPAARSSCDKPTAGGSEG